MRFVVVALVAAVLASAPPASAQSPRETAHRILGERQYAFCHDAARRVQAGDQAYCGYLDAESDCPEFARACATPPTPARSCERPSNPASMQSARTVLLILLAMVTAVLLVLLARAILRARRGEHLVDASAAAPERPSAVPISAASAAELFARALDACERGDLAEALYGLYGALLRRLDERGVIRIDATRTHGDYLRECELPALREPLRETIREVERVRFGSATPTRATFDRLRSAVEPIVRSAGVVVLALALFGGTLAACRDATGLGVPTETGPAGHRAVRELLRAQGLSTGVLREPPEEVRDVGRVLVLDGAAVDLSAEQWTAMLDWVGRGGALVVAGGSSSWPAALRVQTGTDATAGATVVFATQFGGLTATLRAAHPMIARRSDGYAVASSPRSDGAYAVLLARGAGRVLVLASNELVTNGGIAVGDNAAALVAVVRHFAEGRELFFVEDAEAGADNPLRSIARAGVLPALLQALLLLALFYVMVGRHFTTPRDRTAGTRRAFADHVRAVGFLYARARASRHVLRAYGALALERARERTASGASAGASSEALAARLGVSREEVDETLAALERARAGTDAANEAGDLRLVRRLNDWMRKLS